MELIPGKRYRVTDHTGNSLICRAIDRETLAMAYSYLAGRMDMGWLRLKVDTDGRHLKIELLEDQAHG